MTDYAERIYAYTWRGPKDSRYKTNNISANTGPTWSFFFGPYFLNKMGWIKPKTISRYCHFKRHRILGCKCRANTIKFQWKRKTYKHFNIFKHIFTRMYILFSALIIMYVYPRITRRLSAAYYSMHNYMLLLIKLYKHIFQPKSFTNKNWYWYTLDYHS